jgi:quinolinate synthase
MDTNYILDTEGIAKARALAAEKGILVLAHSYQTPDVQEAAGFVGDSLELSKKARAASEGTIVFCGVRFMAETAKLLAPDRRVILPVRDALCFMADMIDPGKVDELKRAFPGLPVVAYVNSTAAVKAKVDICCTSANAARVAKSLPGDAMIMVPDRNLARYCAKVSGKRVETNDGFCPVHVRFTAEDVRQARQAHPKALLLAHPECEPDVQDMADEVLSTGQMFAKVAESSAAEFLIATEAEVMYRMSKQQPDKRFFSVGSAKHCVNMKKTRLSDLIAALEGRAGEVIEIPEDIARLARVPIERMLEL